MEDNDTMLKTAINLHYHDRPNVVANAMQVIEDYCKKEQTDSEYDEVLKTLHDLMNDLPPNILLYFLTTVPLPIQKGDSVSTFSELMKKSRASLIDNMKPVLLEYLNNAMPPLVAINNQKLQEECLNENKLESEEVDKCKDAEKSPRRCLTKRKVNDKEIKIGSSKPTKVKKGIKQPLNAIDVTTEPCKKLIEICAEYVVVHLNEMQKFYNTKNRKAWRLVNKNICSSEEQAQCYKHIEDLNRKLQWLRMIESGHISVDVIKELYGKSEKLIKERHLYNIIDEDAFVVCEELEEAILKFINS